MSCGPLAAIVIGIAALIGIWLKTCFHQITSTSLIFSSNIYQGSDPDTGADAEESFIASDSVSHPEVFSPRSDIHPAAILERDVSASPARYA